MYKISPLLLAVACCCFACGGSVSGNDSASDASIAPDVNLDSSNKDSGAVDGSVDGALDGTIDAPQDSSADVNHPCPSSIQPGSACASEGQSCNNYGCSSGQSSEMHCSCASKKWMCSALSCPQDASVDVDPITTFVNQMNGIWLVGWTGGLRHYSWVRIRAEEPGNWSGTAEFLAGEDLDSNLPYWACSGVGSWMIPQKPNSIVFQFPSSCPDKMGEYTFDFLPSSSMPKGSILAATVTPLSGTLDLEGFKFPSSQCDAKMATCIDPL